MSLTSSLEISEGDVVALVGAGGKTSLMYAIAHELMMYGKKTVVTTTTKIWPPSKSESSCIVLEESLSKAEEILYRQFQEHSIVVLGTRILPDGKMAGIPPEWVVEIQRIQGISNVLVEADGAAGKPMKAPKEYEPVIPVNSSLVLSVIGVDALGKELSESNVHRIDRVSALTGLKPGDIITGEAMATVMLHPQGNVKGAPKNARIIPVINKVDDIDQQNKAREIARFLIKHGARKIILSHAAFKPELVEVING